MHPNLEPEPQGRLAVRPWPNETSICHEVQDVVEALLVIRAQVDVCTNVAGGTSSTYPLLNVAAVWEYVLVFGILGTILSFLPEVVFEESTSEEE